MAVLLAVLGGYDALSMAFAAPAVSAEWAMDKATAGVLLSSGLFAMAAGSLGLSPFADVVGCKPIVLCGLALMTAGLLPSVLCHTVTELLACRVVTGLGIGVMVALTTSIAAEFVSVRNRPMAAAATTVGLFVSGVAGGLAAAILKGHSWIWIFLDGAAASAALLLLALARMPASPAFIVGRRAPNALGRLNRVLAKLARPQVAVHLPRTRPAAHVPQRAVHARAGGCNAAVRGGLRACFGCT